MRKTQRKTTQREKEMTGIVTKYLKIQIAEKSLHGEHEVKGIVPAYLKTKTKTN
jgi:hypothetical protein